MIPGSHLYYFRWLLEQITINLVAYSNTNLLSYSSRNQNKKVLLG